MLHTVVSVYWRYIHKSECILCFCGLQAGNADDDSDAEYSDDGAEETQLESYNTPLDDERCPVDEYIAFKEILSSE